MVKVTYVAHDGESTTIDAEEGASVMKTAVSHDVDGIVGECGGSMMCATCHCYVDEAWAEKVGTRKVVMGRADVSACSRCIDSMNLEPEASPIVMKQTKPGQTGGYSDASRRGKSLMSRGDKELVTDFSSRITKAREKMGMDKRQLAMKLAEKVNVIQAVESGKWPTDAVISKLEAINKDATIGIIVISLIIKNL